MKKYCLVRFDDLCPTMDKEQFNRAFALVKSHGIKPLLGVIPDNRDSDQNICEPDGTFWDTVKKMQSEGCTIAMHGHLHLYDRNRPKTILCGRKRSEFAGNAYEIQFEKIKKGKEILSSHGIETDVFFAPAHTYDGNTLKALYDNGFRYISDGFSVRPYRQNGIICVPCRSFGVPRRAKKGITVAVNHPSEWSRRDKAKDYDALKEFCERNEGYFVSFEDLKKIKCGNFFLQKAAEKLFRLVAAVKKPLRKIIKRGKH